MAEARGCKPSDSSSSAVELGFAEKSPSWILRSKFFRSKLGGKPSWLVLDNLPEPNQLQCKSCGKPCMFLMQVYAPLDDTDDAFHRTIYLFMCRDGKCCKKFSNSNLIAFRNQLPRNNNFYSFEPPEEIEKDSDMPSASQFSLICDVCGCKGEMKCEKCENRTYCCEEHKVIDSKSGHLNDCESKTGEKSKKKKKQKSLCLPEYEIVTDTEDLPPPSKEKSEKEKMQEYEQFLHSAKAKSCLSDGQLEDIENFMKKPDKLFNKFQKRVALEPEQILRYQRGGVPLWVSSEHIPSDSDIPNCSACGAKRVFEFQVMPQLLNYLKLDAVGDSVDWGTLICYTCSKSCSVACSTYVEEFIWKQDFSDDKERT